MLKLSSYCQKQLVIILFKQISWKTSEITRLIKKDGEGRALNLNSKPSIFFIINLNTTIILLIIICITQKYNNNYYKTLIKRR